MSWFQKRRKEFNCLWEYECAVHRRGVVLLKRLPFIASITPPMSLLFTLITLLIIFICLYYFSSWQTIIDEFIIKSGIVASAVMVIPIFYMIYRAKAAAEIYNEDQNTIAEFKEKIRPKLTVLFEKGKDPFFQTPQNPNNPPYGLYVYRIAIMNNGVDDINNIEAVFARDIAPKPNELKGLPLNLHFMNDLTYSKSVNLKPGLELFIDVFNYERKVGGDWMEVTHIVKDPDPTKKIDLYSKIPIKNYTFRIQISSSNGGSAITKTLTFDPSKAPADRMEVI